MAGLIRQSDIEEVKARTNIADVVGDYVSLKSAGVGSLKGLCPFHDERSPSFNVRPQAGFYHCFGCGESGDVYTFLQRMDHVTFSEAVERLAGRIGFGLHYEDGAQAAEQGNRARLLAANQAAEEFFRDRLGTPEAEIGRRFLGERGFDAVAAERFGVGFAPKSWDQLTKHLRSRGFTPEELTAAGLVSAGDRGSYDRFRGRLVWPIRDVTGQTVGFGARRLLDDDKGPKYLNTPETTVYRKSQVLYGLDLAKREIGRQRRVVVVEGYTDVMACHLAGVTTAIATCGTAFGTDHITVLRRVLGDDSGAGEVIFTFDPDAAGQKAALRAFGQEQRFAAQTYVAVGPDGLDPCDLRLQRGDDAVRAMLDSKKPMFEFVLRQLISRHDLDTVEGRIAALRASAPVVAEIRDPALRPGYSRELARMLGMDLGEVTRAVAAAGSASRAQKQQTPSASAPDSAQAPGTAQALSFGQLGADAVSRLERDALMALLQYPGDVGHEKAGLALRAAVGNPTLAVVRDAMISAFDAFESPSWVERVLAEVPEPFAPVVRQLAVAPLPERNEELMPAYVRGVTASLVEKSLLARKAELLGSLQRADPAGEGYRELQRSLVAVETERRQLRDD